MEREELIKELNEAMEFLYHSAEADNKDIATFLHQSINLNADLPTLQKILADVRKFSRKWAKN